jgi:hypothetical protein
MLREPAQSRSPWPALRFRPIGALQPLRRAARRPTRLKELCGIGRELYREHRWHSLEAVG